MRFDAEHAFSTKQEWLEVSVRRIIHELGPATPAEIFSSLYSTIEPWQALLEETGDINPLVDSSSTDPNTAEIYWEPYEAELPVEIVFLDGDRVSTESSSKPVLEPLSQDSLSEWSTPILFFPDGSTSDASVLLQNERQLVQRVTLRGLTGIARVSDVLTLDQAQQLKVQ